MHQTLSALVILTTVLTSGCGIIRDRSDDYLSAESGQELTIPPWYRSDEIRARYPVPELASARSLPKSFTLPEPPDATAVLSSDPYEIESVEDQTWLHLFTSPGKVWPLLDYFWAEYDIDVRSEDIPKGFVLTEALDDSEAHASLISELEDAESKPLVVPGIAFQARLGQGVRRNSAELQVRAIRPDQMDEAEKGWFKSPQNPKLEQALLARIGDFVTADSIENRYSLLANDIGGESRVRLLEDVAGIPYLELELSFQRAWSEVGQALESSGVLVSDRDRSERVYYISYLDREEIDGWFTLNSVYESKRLEQNLALRLETDEEGRILVTVERLNPDVEEEKVKTLLNIVFEHIS